MNILRNKKAQGTISSVLIASVTAATIVSSYTNWMLSMKNNEHEVSQALVGQTIAMNKWDEIIHQSAKEKEDNVNKTDISTDKDGNKTTVTYGGRGIYRNGKCDTSASSDEMKSAYQTCTDVKVKVDDSKGKNLYEFNSVSLSSTTYAYPVGSIIPYTGDLEKIPVGWHLCDGINGTPNLNNTFLKGTSQQSEIGETGGNNQYTLKQENLPSATFDINIPNNVIATASHMNPISTPYVLDMICSWNGNVMLYMHNLATYIHFPAWKSVPFPVAPKHQTTAYIMKFK